MNKYQAIKNQLYNRCVEFAQQRVDTIQKAVDAASESQNDETKSSAGDKHETGRAMMQLEQENNTAQLLEAIKLRESISKINSEQAFVNVAAGCLVITNLGNFYIAISVGKIALEGDVFYAISPVSPLASHLLGFTVNQEVLFNGKKYCVEALY